MSRHSTIYVGVDIGGTSIKCMVFDTATNRYSDLNKRMMAKYSTAQEEVERNVCSIITDTIAINGYKDTPAAIGVSCAALVHRTTGSVAIWPNNPLWNGFPLQQHLATRFQTNVMIEDDANAFTLAEMAHGSGKNSINMAYITISSGIGCGLIINRTLYTGTHGWAGELGHIRIPGADATCVCGKTGCLQSVASGWALFKKAVEINALQTQPAILKDLEDVVKLAQQRVIWAQQLFEDAAASIAYAIEYLVLLLDIDLFILGGGVTNAGDLILHPISTHLDLLLKPVSRNARIQISTLDDNGGALGALQLVLKLPIL